LELDIKDIHEKLMKKVQSINQTSEGKDLNVFPTAGFQLKGIQSEELYNINNTPSSS
jgi:plasmid maintenance system killer protein